MFLEKLVFVHVVRKVHYRVRRRTPLEPVLEYINVICILTPCLRLTFFIILRSLSLSPKWSVPSD